MANVKLKNILTLSPYMKIAIDNKVELDEHGNYLINIGYERVSTDRQAELGFGLEIQEKEIVNYCQRNELTNLVLFIDDGYTGTNMDRPALQAIIDLITSFNDGYIKVRINNMIVPRIDRLGRTLLGTLQFIQDYIVARNDSKSLINKNKEDINFISIAENYCRIERNNPQGKFLLMLFATLAEFDRDVIVDKLKKGRQARVASGKWMGGGNAPYGYKYDKEQGQLIVIPEQAKKVQEIFRLYIEEKMSPQKIADRLGFKGEKIVVQILQRKSLTGCITYLGQEYEGQHEAIISLERWLEAQEEFKKRSVVRGDSNYLLTGLVYCGECGARMRYQKWGKTGECKFVCYSHQKSKKYMVKDENCDNLLFWQHDIEKVVVESLFQLSHKVNDETVKMEQQINSLESLKKQLEIEKRKLSKLYDFDDGSDDDILTEKILNCRKKITDLQQQIMSVQENEIIINQTNKINDITKNLQSTWNLMTDKEKQSICRELIDRVVINKTGVIDVYFKSDFIFDTRK